MAAVLILIAVLAAGAGALFLSEATTGVGIIALGCFCGILARIAQASAQHKELKNLIIDSQKQTQAQQPDDTAE